jgi:hypothetical protein
MWEPAEKVQKNANGEYRALIGGEWIPVQKAQKSPAGEFRIMRNAEQPKPSPVQPQQPESFMGKAALAADRGLSKVGDVAANLLPGGAAIKWGAPDILPSRQNVVDTATGASSLMRGTANQIGEKTGIAPVKGYGLGDFVFPTNQSSHSGWETFGKAIDPVALAIGSKAKYAKVLGGTAKDAAIALLKNAVTGSATGSTIGTLSDDGTALEGAEAGALYSLLGPAAETVGKVGGYVASRGGQIADLFRKGGEENILNRYQNTILGGSDKQKLATALRTSGEIVPGSKPTAAEALAGIPEGSPLVAHQKIVAETPGGVSSMFGQRNLDQQNARAALLKEIAKTPKELEIAEMARDNVANFNFGKAYDQAIKADSGLVGLSKNPFFQDEVDDALKLMSGKPKNLTQFLHYVKVGLDDKLSKVGDNALNSAQKAAVQKTKNELLGWLKNKNPQYDVGRREFARMSDPINQMEIGQLLEKKLVNPTGKETGGSYLAAIDDSEKLAKQATGSNLAKLNPENRQRAELIAKDLERKLSSMNPPQKTSLQGGVNVADDTRAHVPQMLWRPAMLANALLKAAGSGIEPKIDALAAERYLNPKKLAEFLGKIPKQDKMAMENFLKTYQPAMTAGMVNVSQGE